MIYDTIIIGGGASGMSAAITLGSAQDKFDWAADKKILLIDSGKSDLKAASFWNAPGIYVGKDGNRVDGRYEYTTRPIRNHREDT